jgi:hypothetical protein
MTWLERKKRKSVDADSSAERLSLAANNARMSLQKDRTGTSSFDFGLLMADLPTNAFKSGCRIKKKILAPLMVVGK